MTKDQVIRKIEKKFACRADMLVACIEKLGSHPSKLNQSRLESWLKEMAK